jgi:hypothetical protein
MTPSNLFSIDVDAHLKKAASHTFGSPSHYPVELVRSALRRGAQQVDIKITRNRIETRDNGSGLDPASIKTLISLLDPRQPIAVKEEAVEALQTRSGFGLLALFASSPEKILVENVSAPGKTRILFQKGMLSTFDTCGLTTGTHITLFTHTHSHRDITREKQILQVYCQGVQRDIRLNNRLISGGPLLSQQMAYLKITPSTHISHGVIGIPPTGDLCRLRLLDQGIPYRYVTLPPYKGFIFDAAIGYPYPSNGEITKSTLNHLMGFVFQLYQWLCQRHATASPQIQARIEELIFTHYRLTGDTSFFRYFSPFKVFQSSDTLSLTQIMRQSSTSPIFAVPLGKERLRYNTTGKKVLSLTREQADFLINQQNLPITFLSPVFQREKQFPKLLYSFKKMFKRIILYLFPTPSRKKMINLHQLSSSEQFFINTLNQYLSQSSDLFLSHGPLLQAVMIPSRGPFPSIPSKKGKKSHPLFIRRSHPLIRKAINAVQRDPRNVEIFVPLII